MISFKQYIVEKPVKLHATLPYRNAEDKDIRGLINPSESELTAYTERTPNKEVRILVNKTGKLWVFNATVAIHQEIITGEGLYKEDLMLGKLEQDEDGWIIQFSKWEGRDKYAKKNKTLAKLMKNKDNEVTTY